MKRLLVLALGAMLVLNVSARDVKKVQHKCCKCACKEFRMKDGSRRDFLVKEQSRCCKQVKFREGEFRKGPKGKKAFRKGEIRKGPKDRFQKEMRGSHRH